MKLSTGAVLLLLPWFGGPVLGELSKDFSNCLKFFYKETPPKGFSSTGHQAICQRYKNQYRFASLYNQMHHAPIYSAYKLSTSDGTRPSDNWMYEPQLGSPNASPEMQSFKKSSDNNVKDNQAVIEDYKDSGYTKGHLAPSSHQETMEDREATFTLTNIVPQKEGSNTGPWRLLEEEMKNRLKEVCTAPIYVITGTMPYLSEAPRLKNRVSVPEYIWSAYCCPSYKGHTDNPLFPTYAAVGRNDNSSGDEIVPVDPNAKATIKGYEVKQMPLNDLEAILKTRLGMTISLFDGQCGKA